MRTILACLLACCLSRAVAQKKPLTVGAGFPYNGSFVFKNNSARPVIVADLKGENIIIDLFSSTCVVCFQMLPKINQLQQQFSGHMRFLLVGYHDKKIESLYQKFSDRLKLQLEVAFDSLFFKAVDITSVPTYIWISKTGKIAAVTGPDELTAENIDQFVQGKQLAFGAKPKQVSYSYLEPYLLGGNGGPDSNFLVRSLLGKWNPAIPFYMPVKLQYNRPARNFNALGVGLEHLYNYAYWGKAHWEDRDLYYGKVWPKPVMLDKSGDTILPGRQEKFCYGAAYNGEHAPDLSGLLQKDLESYFGFAVSIESRHMPCYTVRLQSPGILRSPGSPRAFVYSHAGFDFHSVQFREVIELLAYYNTSDLPFIDETGINYPVSIKVDALLTDPADFFNGLQKAGILVEPAMRPMKVLVLRKQKDVAAK